MEELPRTSELLAALSSSRSSSLITSATISPFDVTSATTDNHQSPWLPQPPSSQPPAPVRQSPNQPQQQADFVLFPSPSSHQAPDRNHPQTTPSSTPRRPHNLQTAAAVLNHRRHSAYPTANTQHLQIPQVSSPSPVQDPRVASVIAQSHGYPPSSYRSSLPGTRRHSPQLHLSSNGTVTAPDHANSFAPSPSRPPVPLFSEQQNTATGNFHPTATTQAQTQAQYQYQQQQNSAHRRVMSTSSIPQDFDAFFDLTTNSFVDGLGASDNSGAFDQQLYDTMAGFTSVNSDGRTVSPKDLVMDTATAPPSTSFTDLSTPSFESGSFSHDPSPLFANEDIDPAHENWESLFQSEPTLVQPKTHDIPMPPTAATTPAKHTPAVGSSPMIANDSSPGESPRTGRSSGRHSSVSGVKSRQRDKPLPPITYDATDPVAAKRARNTEAARKSRARKVELQEQMESRIAELEKTLEETRRSEQYWKSIAQTKQ